MRLRAIILAIMIAPQMAAATPFLAWDAPTTDDQGNPLAPDVVLTYEVYMRNQGSAEPRVLFGATDGELYIDLAGAPGGCIDYAAVAIRTDTTPELISALSEPVVACDFNYTAPNPQTELRVQILMP